MEENCNERSPSQLADVTNIVHEWGQCSECGELRVVRKWHVIGCRRMTLQNCECVQGESATKGYA